MMLWISSELLARLAALAAASPEAEVCGLLLGRGNEVEAILPAANVAAMPAMHFEVDPAALIGAHRASREGGPQVIGCYHSHPNGRAEPSAEDAAQASPDGQFWIIVAQGSASCWKSLPKGARHGRFDPVALATPGGLRQRPGQRPKGL
jgi:proteasome lid subunit RPN8/RPN11